MMLRPFKGGNTGPVGRRSPDGSGDGNRMGGAGCTIPGGGKATRGGGNATPGGGMATPLGGSATPGGGSATPGGGSATPDGGSATPGGGRATEGGGRATPGLATAVPTVGGGVTLGTLAGDCGRAVRIEMANPKRTGHKLKMLVFIGAAPILRNTNPVRPETQTKR